MVVAIEDVVPLEGWENGRGLRIAPRGRNVPQGTGRLRMRNPRMGLCAAAVAVLGTAFAGEVEYVESTGSQYFNTGVVPGPTTRLVVTAQFTKYGSTQMMGWAATNPGEAFLIGVNESGRPTGIVTPDNYSAPYVLTNAVLSLGKRHTWDFSSGAQILDGKTYRDGTIGNTAEAGQTLCLFARYREWGNYGHDNLCHLRLYSCQIYDGNTLVKDYVPFRSEDGSFGLSNRVDGVFAKATYGTLYGPVDVPVEYVEATGEQHLDTGYTPTDKTRLVADIQYTSVPASALAASGWHSNGGKEAFVFGVTSGSFRTCVHPSNVWQDSGVPADTKRRVFDIQSGSQKLGLVENGATNLVQFATSTYADPDSSARSIYLFARHAEWAVGMVNGWCAMRVYGLRIYEDGVLVRDFVPCVRNGKAGLKDILSGSFCAGGGFGLKRPISASEEYDYALSDGRQYLNTGIVPAANTRIVTDLQYTKTAAMSVMGWAGAVAESISFGLNSNCFACAFLASGYRTAVPIVLDGAEVPIDAGRHTFDLKSGSQKFDGREFGTGTIGNSATVGQQMYLFARHTGWEAEVSQGSSSCNTSTRLYSCRIYSGDTLVRDFVPCVADGVAGLLDRVTGVFMPSETALPLEVGNLEQMDRRLYYIDGTGTQYINTGFVPSAKTRVVTDLRFRDTTTGAHQMMGWAATNPGEGFLFGFYSTGYFGGYLNMNYSSPVLYALPADKGRHVFDFASGQQMIDGTVYGTTSISSTAEAGQTLYLFARHREWAINSPDWFCKMRMYSCKIYENGMLVRDFVPALSSGRACLFDQIYKKVYYSATATDFIAGVNNDRGFIIFVR